MTRLASEVRRYKWPLNQIRKKPEARLISWRWRRCALWESLEVRLNTRALIFKCVALPLQNLVKVESARPWAQLSEVLGNAHSTEWY